MADYSTIILPSSPGESGASNVPNTSSPGAVVYYDQQGNLAIGTGGDVSVNSVTAEDEASAGAVNSAALYVQNQAGTAGVTADESGIAVTDQESGTSSFLSSDGVTAGGVKLTDEMIKGIVIANPSETLYLVRKDGNSATATKLETSRTINGVGFDGSGNISLPGNILHDTQANRPAASKAGLEFCPTDGCGPVRQIDNGSSYDGYYLGLKCSPPPAAADLSQIHFSLSAGTASLTDAGPCLLMTQTGNNSTSLRDLSMAVQAIPASGTYVFDIGVDISLMHAGYSFAGICVTDGNGATPKSVGFHIHQGTYPTTTPFAQISLDTNPTTQSSATTMNIPILGGATRIFMRMRDDRTNLELWLSHDGKNLVRWWVASRTAFLTPAYMGVVLGQQGTTSGGSVATTLTRSIMKIFHWYLGA